MSDGVIVWSGSWWVAGAVWFGTLLWVALSMWRRRFHLSTVFEAIALVLAGGAAGLAAAGPTRIRDVGTPEPGRIVALVDASRSMRVLEAGTERSADVADVLNRLRRLGPAVDVYHYGADLRAGPPSAYDLPDTDVLAALGALRDRIGSERLSGIVVVTDGIDRGPLADAVAANTLPELSGPLSVVQVGGQHAILDLAVRDVDAGGWAFVRTPFTLRARVEGSGAVPGTVGVSLLQDGAPISAQRVVLDADGGADVRFEVIPSDAGRFHYEVAVDAPAGDAVPSNNSLPVVVSVVRDRMRVLQVAGAPGWDVKFLRRFLKGDPGIQLVCFYILRTPADLDGAWRDDEISLIQFPYEDLFDEQIDSFDIIILQNFDHEPYFREEADALLGNVADWVKDGGGLVVVGGDKSFGQAGYGQTPLGDVLPVLVPGPSTTPLVDPFRPILTPEGERHPLTRLVGEAAENANWWARLPLVDGVNVVSGGVPGAAVLLAHPTAVDLSGNPLPVLAVREVGSGRSMALMTDASWRWSVTEAASGRGNQAYLRFWKNALRWLLRDPALSRVAVDTPRENYRLGEDVRVVARVRDPGFAPLAGARVVLRVSGPSEPVVVDGVTGPEGEVVFPWSPPSGGTWRLSAEADQDGRKVGTAETLVAVNERDPELDRLVAGDLMLRWTELTTGRFMTPSAWREPLLDPAAGRIRLERTEERLEHNPWVGWWVAGWLAAAVGIRRASGAI